MENNQNCFSLQNKCNHSQTKKIPFPNKRFGFPFECHKTFNIMVIITLSEAKRFQKYHGKKGGGKKIAQTATNNQQRKIDQSKNTLYF